MQGQEPTQADSLPKLKEELARLRAKRAHSDDADIKRVLDMRISELEAAIPKEQPKAAPVAVQAEVAPAAPVEPPTPAQIQAAEQFIRLARVEKMRGNAHAATSFLKQAVEAAPGSVPVLEALGDDLLERRQVKEALETYRRAFELAPKNVAIEKKYATLVIQVESLGSLDDQMRRNLSDSPFLTSDDRVASGPAAILMSAFLPGSGHLILGQTARGLALMAGWLVCGLWVLFRAEDLTKLFAFMGGAAVKPNMVVLLPIAIMLGIYVGTLGSLKGVSQSTVRRKVDRPAPPPEAGGRSFE